MHLHLPCATTTTTTITTAAKTCTHKAQDQDWCVASGLGYGFVLCRINELTWHCMMSLFCYYQNSLWRFSSLFLPRLPASTSPPAGILMRSLTTTQTACIETGGGDGARRIQCRAVWWVVMFSGNTPFTFVAFVSALAGRRWVPDTRVEHETWGWGNGACVLWVCAM